MQEHHTAFANILVALTISVTPFLIKWFDVASGFSAKLAPIIGLAVVSLQLYLLVRKSLRR
jgi:hypothetical protein